jgi:hypothetical protein
MSKIENGRRCKRRKIIRTSRNNRKIMKRSRRPPDALDLKGFINIYF